MNDPVILSKLANCLMAAATPSESFLAAYGEAGMPAGSVRSTLGRFKDRHGGLWVGGRLTVTESQVWFEANGANRAAHDSLPDVHLQLARVRSVDVLPGVVTKIIAISTDTELVMVRCFGARTVAQRIRDAMGPS